jgi:hypothetical protein
MGFQIQFAFCKYSFVLYRFNCGLYIFIFRDGILPGCVFHAQTHATVRILNFYYFDNTKLAFVIDDIHMPSKMQF